MISIYTLFLSCCSLKRTVFAKYGGQAVHASTVSSDIV